MVSEFLWRNESSIRWHNAKKFWKSVCNFYHFPKFSPLGKQGRQKNTYLSKMKCHFPFDQKACRELLYTFLCCHKISQWGLLYEIEDNYLISSPGLYVKRVIKKYFICGWLWKFYVDDIIPLIIIKKSNYNKFLQVPAFFFKSLTNLCMSLIQRHWTLTTTTMTVWIAKMYLFTTLVKVVNN